MFFRIFGVFCLLWLSLLNSVLCLAEGASFSPNSSNDNVALETNQKQGNSNNSKNSNRKSNSTSVASDHLKNANQAIKKTHSEEVAKIPFFEEKIGDWYLSREIAEYGRQKCYLVLYPSDRVGNSSLERKPYFMMVIDYRKKYSLFIATGYYFAKGSKVFLSIDGKQFDLETNDYIAKTKMPIEDRLLVGQMMKSSNLLVYGRSADGSYSVDTYLLRDLDFAHHKMVELCNVVNKGLN